LPSANLFLLDVKFVVVLASLTINPLVLNNLGSHAVRMHFLIGTFAWLDEFRGNMQEIEVITFLRKVFL
jgi:hypothetical protein